MEYNNITTKSRKNKYLNDFERGQIQLLHNKGYSAYKIAKELNRASNTIRNELVRKKVLQIKNNKEVKVYYPNNSQERGSNEKHNSLIRQFLPKGKSLLDYNEDHYIKIMN